MTYPFSAGDNVCDLGSVALKQGLCWVAEPFLEGSPSLCDNFSSRSLMAALVQDNHLILKLASACALQGVWIVLAEHPLWQPLRPMLLLSCLTLRRPFGLTLGFNRARAWCLDVAHFSVHLASTVHAFGALMSPISWCVFVTPPGPL